MKHFIATEAIPPSVSVAATLDADNHREGSKYGATLFLCRYLDLNHTTVVVVLTLHNRPSRTISLNNPSNLERLKSLPLGYMVQEIRPVMSYSTMPTSLVSQQATCYL